MDSGLGSKPEQISDHISYFGTNPRSYGAGQCSKITTNNATNNAARDDKRDSLARFRSSILEADSRLGSKPEHIQTAV